MFHLTGSLAVDNWMKGLFLQVLTNPSSATTDFQESMWWNKWVTSELIHHTSTLANCFCHPEVSPSVFSPLIPSVPMASTASLAAFQSMPSQCLFPSAMRCQLQTFYISKISYLPHMWDYACTTTFLDCLCCCTTIFLGCERQIHNLLSLFKANNNLFHYFQLSTCI